MQRESTELHLGDRWFQVTGDPILDADGQYAGAIHIVTDITDRKQAEEERQKLQTQLNQAQKMECVGRLAGGVAHDFNNILQAIMCYGRFLLETLPPGSETYDNAKEVYKGTERAASLTRQLLAFSRQQVLERKNVDVNDLVQNLLKMIGRLLGEDIELNFHPASRNVHVFSDPGQLEQVLMNLCVNARDAMPEGGLLEIEVSEENLSADYCEIQPWAKPGKYVLLRVSDNGTGMDSTTLSYIFEPFFTTKDFGKGTGLGLATVYGIVQQHEGFIHVYSEKGMGSVFKIYLPLAPEESQETETEVAKVSWGGHETILLVEDDVVLRTLAVRILEPAGYKVIAASNGVEAIHKLEEHHTEINLLLSDVLLPKGNGQEIFTAFLKYKPEGRAILMSGYGSNIIKDEFWKSGKNAFLQKPFGPEDLLSKVRQVIDASQD
ncbi:TPA: hybrid sensor histidine kinase/response regulator [Candidatus Sumerlaeota bacterium]|nr:hybrid sensor histidine kinase/response regulator [Candidatus Sumerlaeota bacterium]